MVRQIKRLPFASLAMLIAATLLLVAPQSTWYVDDDAAPPGDGSSAAPYVTIQDAIDAPTTLDGDSIVVRDGVYRENLLIDGKRVHIRSESVSAQVRIEPGPGQERNVAFKNIPAPGASILGITIEQPTIGANTPNGGLLIENSSVVVARCSIENFSAGNAGGSNARIVAGSTATITDSRFAGGWPYFGGGMHVADSTVDILRCEFLGNSDPTGTWSRGGGLFAASGTVDVTDCLFSGNVANTGSAVFVESAAVTIVGCEITSNGTSYASAYGGGLYGQGLVASSTISGNTAQGGSGVHGSWTLYDTAITGNQVGDAAAEAPAGKGCTYVRCTIAGNRSINGAVVENGLLIECDIRHNSIEECSWCSFPGTSAAVHGSQLFNCRLESNSFRADGFNQYDSFGGAASNCQLISCEIIGNRSGLGAAAHASILTDCVVVANVAERLGSGLTNYATPHAGALLDCTATNCILVDNHSTGTVGAAANSTLNNCTVYRNTADLSSAALENCVVRDSIVWGNSPVQIDGATSVRYSNVEGGALGVGNLNAAPGFWGPASRDVHLRPTSPCIDAANPWRTDPDGSRLDMGALPFDPAYHPSPAAYCDAKENSDGCLPELLGLGALTTTQDDFVLEAQNLVETTFGLAFVARQSSATPYQGGTLCVGGSLIRSDIAASTGTGPCGGTLTIPFGASALAANGFLPGETLYFQVVYRDAADPTGFGLTGGVEATVAP